MDFRLIKAADIVWSLTSRGQPMARTAAGAKVVVQTPLCPCRVVAPGGGMYRVHLALRPDLAVHSAFCEWLCDVEDGAGDSAALAAWRGARSKSVAVYNNSLRVMAFSDTPTFDASGRLSAELLTAGGCTCILELQGGWSTDARWGVRWKAVQIKFGVECDLPPPAPRLIDDSDGDGGTSAEYAFVDD